MPAPPTSPNPVLAATDLSARSDRALERALQLAHECAATLVALNVLEPPAYPDQALEWLRGATDAQLLEAARRQLAEDLGPQSASTRMQVVLGGDVPAAIRSTAAGLQARLVVTGVSSSTTLGRYLLGSTPENLARSLPEPLLVVRKRAHGPYRRIVVATDFSASSRHALRTAARLFPGRELELYHAYCPPTSDAGDTELPKATELALRKACAAFVADAGLGADVKVPPVIERGAIESVLTSYVREHGVDLVVIGNRGASGLVSVLLGSTAVKCLEWLPCDILRVSEPGSTG